MSGKYIWDRQIEKDKDKYLQKKKEEKLKEQIARQKERELRKIKKREELAKKQKEEILKKRKHKEKIRRRTKFFIFFIVFTVIFLFVTHNFFPYNNITIIGSNYYNKDELLKEKESYNLIDIFKNDINIPKENDLILRSNVDVNFKEHSIVFDISERRVLGYNQNDELIYEANGSLYTSNAHIKAPIIIGLDEQQEIHLAQELENLDYKVFNQIETIQQSEKDDTDIITMYMEDGNIIYININEVSEKMKYYPQMKSIIDERGSGPGYIHLDIGDYYEPKN